MNNFSSNFDKNKKHYYDNEYEFKIKSFAIKHNCNFFDDRVIEYAIRLKNEIISSLDKNSSNADKIKVNYIKWIEKYLDEVHENLIERKMKISSSSFGCTRLFTNPLGDCQFEALVATAEADMAHGELRTHVCNHIAEHRETYSFDP